jgi:hypothetical protein
MSEEYSVNRYLDNETMDNIDHALGRPRDLDGDFYRTYFECSDEDEARKFEATGYWLRRNEMCYVNSHGVAALKEYLLSLEYT